MITWMLYRAMDTTFKTLRTADLVCAIKDAQHILDVVTGAAEPREGMKPNHPSYKMWELDPYALGIYGMMGCMELTINRQIADNTFFELEKAMKETRSVFVKEGLAWTFEKPMWFDDTDILRSHRSNLVRRMPDKYGKVWTKLDQRMPYLWPLPTDEGYDIYISRAEKKLLRAGDRKLPKSIAARVANL